MASRTATTILFAFAATFWCLDILDTINKIQAPPTRFARLAATAFLPAVLATFGLTLLLLFSYVRALGRANAAGGDVGRRFLGCLAKGTLLMALAILLAGTALCLVASGYLGGADEDVGWLHTKD